MSEITHVKVSTNYDAFKFYSCNRPISPVHVNRLILDETFPEKYRLSPILVDKEHRIIDGQHRFKACFMLGLPIYYIMDMQGSEEDIKLRNSQQIPWEYKNFLSFHADHIEDYKILKDLSDKYTLQASIFFPVIMKMGGQSNRGKFGRDFKNGNFSLGAHKEKFMEFVDIYMPEIKDCLRYKSKDRSMPYFSSTVVSAFAHHFITNRLVFNKAVKKISNSSYCFPFCHSYEEARQCVEKLAKYREKNIDIE